MPRPLRLLAVLVAVALAAVGLSACGSGDGASSSDGDATALIRDTFAADHPIRSGRLDADLDVDLQGLARLTQPISLHLAGPFQSNGGRTLPDFALQLDLDSGSRPVTIGAVFTDGHGYLTLEGQAFDLGTQLYDAFKKGYEQAKADAKSSSGAAPSLSALGISPLKWLKDPQARGTEDIAGTQTDHVAAQVDVGRLLDDVSTLLARASSVTQAVPSKLTPQQRDAIARSIDSATIDLWTGHEDHTLRKIALNVKVDVPEDLRARAGGLRSGTIAFQATIADLNQPQTIHKPAGAKPLGQLRSVLGQLGLLGSSSSSSAGSASSTTPAAPAGTQADYADCLSKAGEDLTKVQRCADLLK